MTLQETGVHTVNSHEADRAAQARAQSGWRVFRLPTGIVTREDFFEGVRRTLPLDPAVHGNRSWDALSDSLWSGLDELQDERILIVWPDASRMKASDREEFGIATSVLADLCTSLADAEATVGAPKQVLVLQVI
jgi:hypothetical protein